MDHSQFIQEGRLTDALKALKEEVRQTPACVELRARLFALHCVVGQWDKASADLEAMVALDSSWTVPALVYQGLIGAEKLRREVYSARAKPLVMGQPEPWLASSVHALALEAEGKFAEAFELRNQAWESAPEFSCRVDGRFCQWLSDADRRIGPVLEACLDGKYYWIPFGQLREIKISPPEYLVEVVWIPARLTVAGGAELGAQLPARYPGTEDCAEGSSCLGQKTDWVELADGCSRPIGQKLLESEDADFGLLSCRAIEFEPDTTAATPP